MLWWAPLDIAERALEALADPLPSAERDRADRYEHPVDRARFVASRGWLRLVLAHELGIAPADVQVVAGDNGKPMLDQGDLRFSASRSAGFALIATSWTTEVGVDVEEIAPALDIDVDGLASRFFTPNEQRAMAALTPTQRRRATVACWTRKEAYVKGTGAGIGFPMHTIDVWNDGAPRVSVEGWTIDQVDIDPGFAASVAGSSYDGWNPIVHGDDYENSTNVWRIIAPDSDSLPAIMRR
jgi:4'-phosphopantetheinyl transferase